ncbi:hypothetical protein ABPG74_007017 [Tetrahymena malaccensis]
MSANKDIPIYRIALLGVSKVGKTQIVNQFVNNCFNPNHEETFQDTRPYRKLLNLGTDKNPMHVLLIIEDIFATNHPQIEASNGKEDNPVEKLFTSIVDNAMTKDKKEEDKKLNRIYANKQIYGYIFVFDASESLNSDSNKSLKLLEPVIKFISNAESRGVNGDFVTKKIIVGNKKELLSDIELSQLKQNQTLRELGITYKFVSAKYNEDITTIFQEICKQIQEDPKIQTLEEEWQKEIKEGDKEDEGKQSSFKMGFGKKNQQQDDDDDENRDSSGDKSTLDGDFSELPIYQPQGLQGLDTNCNIY